MCIEAATRLVEAHALQGQAPEEERPTWKAPDHLLGAVKTLAARGAIARANEGGDWQLTRLGVQSLSFLLRLHSPERVDAPRRSARKAAHMTRLEMWSALEAGGWSCRPAVTRSQRPQTPDWDLRLDPPAERLFFLQPRGKLPSAPYMQALLSRDELLLKGVHTLPHFRRARFYARVLRDGVVHIRAPGEAALQDDEQVIPSLPAASAPPTGPKAHEGSPASRRRRG